MSKSDEQHVLSPSLPLSTEDEFRALKPGDKFSHFYPTPHWEPCEVTTFTPRTKTLKYRSVKSFKGGGPHYSAPKTVAVPE